MSDKVEYTMKDVMEVKPRNEGFYTVSLYDPNLDYYKMDVMYFSEKWLYYEGDEHFWVSYIYLRGDYRECLEHALKLANLRIKAYALDSLPEEPDVY